MMDGREGHCSTIGAAECMGERVMKCIASRKMNTAIREEL